jgi:hypothetical protein
MLTADTLGFRERGGGDGVVSTVDFDQPVSPEAGSRRALRCPIWSSSFETPLSQMRDILGVPSLMGRLFPLGVVGVVITCSESFSRPSLSIPEIRSPTFDVWLTPVGESLVDASSSARIITSDFPCCQQRRLPGPVLRLQRLSSLVIARQRMFSYRVIGRLRHARM